MKPYLAETKIFYLPANLFFPLLKASIAWRTFPSLVLIENNTVRECGSVAIEIGSRISEAKNYVEDRTNRPEVNPGGQIVQNNLIYNCGTGGIEGLIVKNSIISNIF